ncbi:hypothetical protein EDF46_3579 [Frondihabitans sp. PhB188]|nr:hypothetical protein [Frondihabitans sp. PhB188]ROQ30266.1 hypothetical protein EDF46_3579 [Frondihabitans sp. PhB188]
MDTTTAKVLTVVVGLFSLAFLIVGIGLLFSHKSVLLGVISLRFLF